jgi:hypothetical protein
MRCQKNQHLRLEKLALGNPINLKTIKPNPVVLALSKHLKATEFLIGVCFSIE